MGSAGNVNAAPAGARTIAKSIICDWAAVFERRERPKIGKKLGGSPGASVARLTEFRPLDGEWTAAGHSRPSTCGGEWRGLCCPATRLDLKRGSEKTVRLSQRFGMGTMSMRVLLTVMLVVLGLASRAVSTTFTYQVQGTIESGDLSSAIQPGDPFSATFAFSDSDPLLSSGAAGAIYQQQSLASNFQIITGGITFSDVPVDTFPPPVALPGGSIPITPAPIPPNYDQIQIGPSSGFSFATLLAPDAQDALNLFPILGSGAQYVTGQAQLNLQGNEPLASYSLTDLPALTLATFPSATLSLDFQFVVVGTVNDIAYTVYEPLTMQIASINLVPEPPASVLLMIAAAGFAVVGRIAMATRRSHDNSVNDLENAR